MTNSPSLSLSRVFAIAASALVLSALSFSAGTTAYASTIDTSGFTSQNADGSYGPYETGDMPLLVDQGGYVQSGEIWESYLDQYGNVYYLDLGADLNVRTVEQSVASSQPSESAQQAVTDAKPSPTAADPMPSPTPRPRLQTSPESTATATPQRPDGWELPVMLGKVNEERTSRGLWPLIEDPSLDASAQQYAAYEASQGCYGHNCGDEPFRERAKSFMKTGSNHRYGEDLHLFLDDPIQVVDAISPHIGWMQSPGHRDMILDPRMTRVGAGIAPMTRATHSGPEVGSSFEMDMQPMSNRRFWVLDFAG